MCSPHICRGRVLGLVVGAMEEGQRGRAEECEPVHKYVCIEGKGTVAHFHMDKNIAVHLVPLITIPNIVYMNVIYVDS